MLLSKKAPDEYSGGSYVFFEGFELLGELVELRRAFLEYREVSNVSLDSVLVELLYFLLELMHFNDLIALIDGL